MKPRLGVWCPHGRASLPPAAVACRTGLPPEWIVWSSDDLAPPAPVGVAADLWILLCAGAPPAPPPWRAEAAGVWAIFPGPAAGLDDAAEVAVAAWRPDLVLSDALPDEIAQPAIERWAREGRLRWIPGSIDAPALGSDGPVVAVVTDRQPGDWFAETVLPEVAKTLGGRVARFGERGASEGSGIDGQPGPRLFLDGKNPAAWDGVLRAAVRARSKIAIFARDPTTSLRAFLLADLVDWIGFQEEAGARAGLSGLRSAVRAVLAPGHPGAMGRDFRWGWGAWARYLASSGGAASELYRAAELLIGSWYPSGGDARQPSVARVLRRCFDEMMPATWVKSSPPGLRERAMLLAWCFERLASLEWSAPTDDYKLAQVHAFLGDEAGADAAIARVFGRGTDFGRELPGSVALAFWWGGRADEARRVLRRHASQPAPTAFARYLCAVVAELAAEPAVAGTQLGALTDPSCGSLRLDSAGSCIALGALVARLGGEEALVARLVSLAQRHANRNAHLTGLLAGVEPRAAPLDPRWRAVFGWLCVDDAPSTG